MMRLLSGGKARWGRAGCLAAVMVLAGCGSTGPDLAPVEARDPAGRRAPAATAGPESPATARSRWVPAAWSELPGWSDDALAEVWPALRRSCERPAPGWLVACTEVRAMTLPTEASVREWLQRRMQVFRIESPEGDAQGLITGYYEPVVEASRVRQGAFRVPLHQPPGDLDMRKPYWTRQQLDTLVAARVALRGREIAFVADPLDALVLQIQGSGRLLVREADGSQRLVRLAYAGHNDQPYQSVGRWLVQQGAMTLEQANWPAIKAWARANPLRVQEMLWANPRVVFFREEPLADPELGAVGAQGVPLTPGRSIAVDPSSVPYGTPVWIDTTLPQPWSREPPPIPLRRLVMAQDTGSAITGAVRADYYWGWGLLDASEAAEQAGRMRQPLRMWALWPR